MFKHLQYLQFDSFVADIGLYLSCFSTGIKPSTHILQNIGCKYLVCSSEQAPLSEMLWDH